ncbi:ADP-ribose pyrophosphatase [Pyrobaculum oguniense TE7]|uniref:ADP-ribose pyrophosphatase n=1 Tax=Pyrobaculum oguniense (strain DSM 13380 / JCM 10595 / TE7) TaxID=698757 RepID=H6Q9G3_PYROT|nr:ADP-ribose pyrophosphatase [Pyrobaculum oguniense TE7]
MMEVKYRGKRITVEGGPVRLPNGLETTAERVVFPPVVTVLALHDGDVLFVRQYRPALGRYTLELPSGVVADGETPEDAAARELEEETGFKPTSLELLFKGIVSPGYSTEVAHIFLARDTIPGRISPEPYEVIEVVKIPLSEACEKAHKMEIEDLRATAALALYCAKLNKIDFDNY